MYWQEIPICGRGLGKESVKDTQEVKKLKIKTIINSRKNKKVV